MDRRGFLLSTGAVCAAGRAFADRLPVPPGNEIAFRIFRNGSPVGEHSLRFTRKGQDLTVALNIAAVVMFAGIPVYRYTASATEHWTGDVFQSFDSKVDDGGNRREVHALRIPAGIQVQGTHVPRYIAPSDTLPLTYWNKALLNGPILNIETAHTDIVTVTPEAWDKLPTANDGTIVAQRYKLTGKLHFNVWYDDKDQWAGLELHVRGTETYEKIV